MVERKISRSAGEKSDFFVNNVRAFGLAVAEDRIDVEGRPGFCPRRAKLQATRRPQRTRDKEQRGGQQAPSPAGAHPIADR